MFQPDEPNGIRNAAILWVLGFVITYILLSMNGCATLSEPVPADSCPPTSVSAPDPIDPEVLEHYIYASKGCIRNYGEGACLVRLIRIGPRNYHAVCKARR